MVVSRPLYIRQQGVNRFHQGSNGTSAWVQVPSIKDPFVNFIISDHGQCIMGGGIEALLGQLLN